MSDEAALLAAIGEHPDEDTPRLVYADWLDEQGGAANAARAEFIRVQCEAGVDVRAHGEETEVSKRLDERADKIAAKFEKQWFADFPPCTIDSAYYTRGFLTHLRIEAKNCAKTRRPPWFREPLLVLELAGSVGELKPLIERDWLDGVTEINFQLARPGGGDTVVAALADSAGTGRLRRLALWNEGFTDRGLHAIADGAFENLHEISFMGRFSADAWAAVLASPAATNLEDLTIGHRGPWQTAERTRPGPALAETIASAPAIGGLKQLWLSGCGLGDAGFARLVACGRFPKLHRLHFGNDRAGVALGEALATAPLPALTDLLVSSCEWSDEAVVALANGPLMSQIHQLELSLNRLTPTAARAIARCRRTKALKYLDFGCNDIGDEGVIALMRSRHLPALEELHLSSTTMTDTGADAILKTKWVEQLKTLFMSYNTISPEKQAELTARFGSRLWINGVVRD